MGDLIRQTVGLSLVRIVWLSDFKLGLQGPIFGRGVMQDVLDFLVLPGS
jgi:hypothetical protein